MTALRAACDFLDDYLSNGPRPSLEVAAAAGQEGINAATLRRAARARCVRRTRPYATGPWFMYLPNSRGPATPRSNAVPTSTTADIRARLDVDDGYDVEDEDDFYERPGAAGRVSGWIVAIAVLIFGAGGVVLARRLTRQ